MFRSVKTVRIAALASLTLAATGTGIAVSQAQQRQTPLFFDARRLPDMEVERRNQEVLQEQRRAAEERRLETEANARRAAEEAKTQEARIAAEAAAKKKADEARLAEAEAKKKADEERRVAAEAAAKKKADDDKRLAAEAEAKKKADEAARVAALEAQRKADEEKRLAAEAEAKKKADEAARIAALDAQRKADEEKRRLAAEAEAKKKAEEATRIAALEAQRKADDERKRAIAEAEAEARRKSDEATRQAALAAQARAAPQQTAALIQQAPTPASTAACEATKAQISYPGGGILRATISSPCRKGQPVTVSYGGYETTSVIGNDGQAAIDVDLFLGNTQPVTLSFAGGHTERLQPAARDLSEVSKVALIWQAPVDLDLHALENGVNPGEPGDVWSGSGATGATAKAKLSDGRGGGFLSRSDDGKQQGTKIEVYTFYHSPDQPNGVVTMVLDYVSRGDNPSADFCGNGDKASVPYEVVTISQKGAISRERGLVAPAACGSKLIPAQRLIRDAVPDLQF